MTGTDEHDLGSSQHLVQLAHLLGSSGHVLDALFALLVLDLAEQQQRDEHERDGQQDVGLDDVQQMEDKGNRSRRDAGDSVPVVATCQCGRTWLGMPLADLLRELRVEVLTNQDRGRVQHFLLRLRVPHEPFCDENDVRSLRFVRLVHQPSQSADDGLVLVQHAGQLGFQLAGHAEHVIDVGGIVPFASSGSGPSGGSANSSSATKWG